jgi:hypothetical protein
MFCSVLGLGLAVMLGLQALSTVIEAKAPQLALAVNPFNGHAHEEFAQDRFRDGIADPADLAPAARSALDPARAAFRLEPLVPKALAILALTKSDTDQRRDILAAAMKLNRRDTTLQGVALSQAIEDLDYAGTISAIDRILRVKPQRSAELFPILIEALRRPASASEFVELLDFSSPWHDRFLMVAVENDEARLTLSTIRSDLRLNNEAFDRRLIAGLAAQGEIERARTLYEQASNGRSASRERFRTLSWDAAYPPFDWVLVSRPDLRAQASFDAEKLEIFARTGEGGTIATRLVPGVASSFRIETEVESANSFSPGSLVVRVSCAAGNGMAFEQDLERGRNVIILGPELENCDPLRLDLRARSFTGQPTLRADVTRLRIDARGGSSSPDTATPEPAN